MRGGLQQKSEEDEPMSQWRIGQMAKRVVVEGADVADAFIDTLSSFEDITEAARVHIKALQAEPRTTVESKVKDTISSFLNGYTKYNTIPYESLTMRYFGKFLDQARHKVKAQNPVENMRKQIIQQIMEAKFEGSPEIILKEFNSFLTKVTNVTGGQRNP